MSYFTINNSDGDTRVKEWTKEALESALNEEHWGDAEFPSKLPNTNDTNYWGNSVVIIRGEVVSPEAVKIVTEMRLP